MPLACDARLQGPEETTLGNVDDHLSASEALFGFAAWLTSLKEPITHPGDMASAVTDFCKLNSLVEPRSDWTKNLIQMDNSLTR